MAELLARILILAAIFASVFVISQIVLGSLWRTRASTAAVNRRLMLIKQGSGRDEIAAQLRKNTPNDFADLPKPLGNALRQFQRVLFASALRYSLAQVLLAMLAGFLVLGSILLAGALLAGFRLRPGVFLLVAVLSFAVACAIPVAVLNVMAQRRRKRMEQQFPVALDIFVRALRSGHPIASAIELLTKEMQDPIGSEFGLVSDEITYGAELTDALEAMADRWDLEDIRMFVVSVSVQSETGGNLAEILDNLSTVIRERHSMYLKVRALSSEGRMTAIMLTVLPVFAFAMLFLMNPSFYLDVADDPAFMPSFLGLILMYVIGFITIRKMVDLKV